MRSAALPFLVLLAALAHATVKREDRATRLARLIRPEKAINFTRLDCREDLSVAPLPSLEKVRPYVQMFVLDLTEPLATVNGLSKMYIFAACLYNEYFYRIRLGITELIETDQWRVEPSFREVTDLIGQFADAQDFQMPGAAALSPCERSEMVATIARSMRDLSDLPFRFLLLEDRRNGAAKLMAEGCDPTIEFSKALYLNGLDPERTHVDIIALGSKSADNGIREFKEPVMYIENLEDQNDFLRELHKYIEWLIADGDWENKAVKEIIRDRNASWVRPTSTAHPPDYVDAEVITAKALQVLAVTEVPQGNATTTNRTVIVDRAEDEEESNRWPIFIIALVLLIFLLLIFCVVICCWLRHRNNKHNQARGAAVMRSSRGSDTSSEHSDNRPLILTNKSTAPITNPSAAESQPLDPYSPVKFVGTPMMVKSELEVTSTEMASPAGAAPELRSAPRTPTVPPPPLHTD